MPWGRLLAYPAWVACLGAKPALAGLAAWHARLRFPDRYPPFDQREDSVFAAFDAWGQSAANSVDMDEIMDLQVDDSRAFEAGWKDPQAWAKWRRVEPHWASVRRDLDAIADLLHSQSSTRS